MRIPVGITVSLTIVGLLVLVIGLLFVFEVVLGFPSTTNSSQEGKVRLTIREFVTRLLPLFLFGIGVACLTATPLSGLLLILLSAGLWVYGLRSKP
jgi:hypothetical protein